MTNEQKYDIQKEIDSIKESIMYLDLEKNVHDVISMQCELNKDFARIIQMMISFDYQNVQESIDELTNSLFEELNI